MDSKVNNNIDYLVPSKSLQSTGIGDFYKNAHIFITGATGFLGKVLIEKLLRSCSELKTIYILIRPKRQLSLQERCSQYAENEIFDGIRKENPAALKKLALIGGDVSQPELGLKEADIRELCENVNLVFHMAATVKFNEPLKEAANLNTLGN
jgi:fatty acyl-CoA reductase